jgi:DNA-binding NtrC family response regulator
VKILVIDDEPIVAAVVAAVIQREGHEATVAHDAPEALSLIHAGSPDVVFLDLVMRNTPALRLLKQIRTQYPTLPVIGFSEGSDARIRAEARELGVLEILEKPIVLARLGEALQRIHGQDL